MHLQYSTDSPNLSYVITVTTEHLIYFKIIDLNRGNLKSIFPARGYKTLSFKITILVIFIQSMIRRKTRAYFRIDHACRMVLRECLKENSG